MYDMDIMADLKASDVKHVADLAKLSLNEIEVKRYKKQLSEVVSYVEKLQRVDTKGVEPTSQTTGLENVFSNDQADSKRQLTQKEALSGSENTHNGYFVVPMVLKEKY
jgi:aspartyl-tRNA(Asn)/glutamyl-tRNA(Gln) amidotransferase subunit C